MFNSHIRASISNWTGNAILLAYLLFTVIPIAWFLMASIEPPSAIQSPNPFALFKPTLQNYIGQEAAKAPQPEVHITVDKFAKYEIVAQTLADLQHRGLKKIGFVNNDYF